MKLLEFIGLGSAFNTKKGNTSAFIYKEDSMLLIDCGGTVFHKLMENKLLESLKELNIIITHTHPDHIGSLGEIIFFAHHVLKIVPKVYFPNKKLIKNFLECIGVENEMLEIVDEIKTLIPTVFGDFKVEFLSVTHVNTIPAYGFILEGNNSKIYYSGDSNDISEKVLNMLFEGNLDYIYQDTCGLDYEGNAHLSFRKLCDIIPRSVRARVICIHHDNFLDLEKVKLEGFNVSYR